jgi:hypothetical protein
MSQIFKQTIDKNLLFDFLEKVCNKTEKYYIFDLNAYKRAQLQNEILPFCDSLKPYYYSSKKFYIERKLNYNNLCTIIRQICNVNSILFSSKIVYSKSKYNIPYHIYF